MSAPLFEDTYNATIAGQTWTGTAPGVWRRGACTVRHLEHPLGMSTAHGSGYLATAPGQSAWGPSADTAVDKLRVRAEQCLRSIHRGDWRVPR